MTTPTADWPDRRITPSPSAPQVGDTVELGTVTYRITDLYQTDDGPLARLAATGGRTFVMARELRWDGAMWRTADELPCFACTHKSHFEEDGPCSVLVRSGEFERICGCMEIA